MKIYKIKNSNTSKYVYLMFFIFSCTIFWWMPSIIYFFIGKNDPVDTNTLIISILAILCFSFGYKFLINYKLVFFSTKKRTIYRVSKISKIFSIIFAIPSIILAINFYLYRSSVSYGAGSGLPFIYQVFFYLQMTFFFFYITTTDDFTRNKKSFWFVVIISILIRLIVSLHWGRFFVGQIIFAFFIVAIARGWLKLTFKNIIKIFIIGLLIFFVPAISRGDFSKDKDNKTIIKFIAQGSTLKLYQDNININLENRCNPLLVSLTAKTIPYKLLGICTIDIWGIYGLPATLDRILAFNELGANYMNSLTGPGSNYLLELYVSLGGIVGVFLGSFFLGMFTAFAYNSLQYKTLFGLLWIEYLSRAIFMPRSNVGYAFERFPSLLLTIFFIVILSNVLFKIRYKYVKK